MGVELIVRHSPVVVPSWETIVGLLSGLGTAAPLRMIDGQPAFPDELPPASWRELRVAGEGGMVTIRRTEETLHCIVWGNADPLLIRTRDLIAWACAAATGGSILVDGRELSAAQFAQLQAISSG